MSRTPFPVPPIAVLDVLPERGRFRKDVLRGLRSSPKQLACKYLYDEIGSGLFDRICELDEYYPTRTELAILETHAPEMAARLGPGCLVAEFGSGSGVKTRILLDHLIEPVAYVPIDIARPHLMASAADLAGRYPRLEVRPVCADFTEEFALPEGGQPVARRVVYFPGSTIGNFGPKAATELLRKIAGLCGPGGGLLLGLDLEKDASILEPAYDDCQGVTAAFNLNLLARINRELHADFPVDAFRHHALYNRELGRVEMHLLCLRDLTVHIDRASIPFKAGETIHTESSYKYRLDQFGRLAASAGMRVEQVWTDAQGFFSVQYLAVI